MSVILPNKTSLEFAEENAFFLTPLNGFTKIELYEYQKDLLNTLDNNRFIMVRHSRQMGISTILKLYLANAVINNYDEGKTFVILTPKLSSTYEFLEEVKRLIKQHYDSNKIIVDNKQKLELINGNRIMVCSNSINLFRGYRIDEIIIDGGNYIDNLENIIACVTSGLQMGGKIILASSNSKNNTFFKRIFNDESNKFVKKRITWDLHPNRGKEWYDDMSKHITKEDLEIELDIIDYVEVVEPIKKTISLRIDSSLIDKVSLKLVDMDINLSEYIRRLIEKDLV
jgi:hypothetical protein